MNSKYFTIGAISTAIAIALGAFGAHGLEDKLTEHYLAVFETGVRYQMYSSLGLMLIGLLSQYIGRSKAIVHGARLVIIGMIIFSGSLYILSTTGFSKLGMITPLGGVAMIAGWIFIAAAATKGNKNK